MKYKLFTTQFCHKCPAMKEFIGGLGLEGASVDASRPEGLELAREMQVSGVPTVVFFDESGSELGRFSSKEEVEEFLGRD